MKKLLTVLLAMAIVCTYSIPAVFADADPTYTYDQAYQMLTDDAQAAINHQKDLKSGAVAALTASSYNITNGAAATATISKAAIVAVYQARLDAYDAAVNKSLQESLTNLAAQKTTYTAKTAAEIVALYERWATDLDGVPATTTVVAKPVFNAFASDPTDIGVAFAEYVKAEFDIVKPAAIKGLEAIDLSVYSTVKNLGTSNHDIAQARVANAITIVNGYSYDASTTDAVLANMVADIQHIYVAPVGQTGYRGYIYTTGEHALTASGAKVTGLQDLPMLEVPATAAAKLAYAKAKTLNDVVGTLAARKATAENELNAEILRETAKGAAGNATVIANDKEAIDSINKTYNKAVEDVTYIINNATTYDELGTFDLTKITVDQMYTNSWTVSDPLKTGVDTAAEWTAWFESVSVTPTAATDVFGTKSDKTAAAKARTVKELAARADYVADAKDEAAKIKQTIDIDGSGYTGNLDKALENSVDQIYRGYQTELTGYNNTNPEDALYHYVEGTLIGTAGNTATIADKKYDNITSWAASKANYDAANQDVISSIVTDAKKAVRAAATKEAADAAFTAAYAKYDAVPTASEHMMDFKYSTGANYANYEKAKSELSAYAAARVAYLTQMGQINNYTASTLNNFVDKYNNGTTGAFYTKCFTADDLTAMLAKAKAEVDGLKTKAQLSTEAAAIQAEIAALPTTVTLADKDKVMAVYDKYRDYNDYCTKMFGANSAAAITNAKIITLANSIEAAEIKAVKDAYDAINKDGKATLEEKAAVEALRKAYDDYSTYWVESGNYDDINQNAMTVTDDNVSTFENQIDALEAQAVIEAVAKLPADGSDVAGIAAAKKAYEALSRDAKDTFRHSYAYDKLADLGKVLVRNVEAYKITAKSVAAKGKMTITWKVKGVAMTGVKYQVLRSTQKNAGFKYMKTTSLKKYVNTKNLKAGKTYYYKVRAYITVDGVKYYSDWSNKAFRTAK